jgi:predicted metal-dependent phosphoesterase TrpH
MGWLDLHIHSNVSDDGEFSPKQLINICKISGVKVTAIADHNSVRGIKEAMAEAEKIGIKLIPAIELDCTYNNINLHVLGYNIYKHNIEAFNEIEQYVLMQEQLNSKKRVKYIRDLGISVDDESIMKLSRSGVITGEMIAEVVLKDCRNSNIRILSQYFDGGARSDNPYVNFYWDFCSQGKVAYVPITYITLEEAIKVICLSGGISILAHPGNNVHEDEQLLSEIISKGIEGLEVYSSYHSAEQKKFYNNIAEKKGIIKTVGSDFHGKTKPSIQIGNVEIEDAEDDIYKSFCSLING